ncbi:conserved hypothetical protein [Gloeothece citriformis PCC 7424]|uniref:Uncharacterized protein n=1 Tax=Gloeothece citriformis (strain PCC 7424) TaxID=65393 RepID=B7KC83_GLOC7|nr:hypothetical protein [Gloeothece citriformis]ACK70188.1 conserved hypothetical protein [Gloeothece citriformis PCC 7424]
MIQNGEIILDFYHQSFGVVKTPVSPTLNPSPAFVFSGTQFFVALVAGVLMAFAFQFLLTNLTLATDISTESSPLETKAESWGKKVREIESKVGIWALITVNLALFCACFLAVKLTLINNIGLGAITGVVIWSAFFLILLWLSSKTVNSLLSSVVNTASSSFQGISQIAITALGGKAVNAEVVNTVEESIASVRRELSSAIDPVTFREQVQDYINQLQPPQLDLQKIAPDFQKILSNTNLDFLSDPNHLKNIDRQFFVDLVSNNTNFSEQEINQIANQLETAWQKVREQDHAKLSERLEKFIEKIPAQISSDSEPQKEQSSNLGKQALQYGIASLFSKILDDDNLSELELGKHLKNLPKELSHIFGQNDSENTIKSDVKDYLLHSKSWHLNRETLKQEFRDVIYDPEANPGLVRQQLESVNRDFFEEILKQRKEFSSDKINEITDQLTGIRQEIFEQVKNAETETQNNTLREKLEKYLGSIDQNLNPEEIENNLKSLLQDPEAEFNQLCDRLSQFDRDPLKQMLSQTGQNLNDEQINTIVNQFEKVRDSVLSEAKDAQEQAKSKAQEWGNQIESYLKNTNKEELNPENIQADLEKLVNEPQQGAKALKNRLSQFDRDTLVKLLSQREDLSEEDINRFVDRFLEMRDNIFNAPSKLAGKAKDEYEQVKQKIADYLRNTNLEELNPEGIKQDLGQLFEQPQEGAKALKNRLSQVDRETLVKLLSQREDLSEEQINETVDQIQDVINNIVKAPRRLAKRTTKKVENWQSQLEDYLRKTDQEELNPQGIKRDLKLLIEQPGSGFEKISDRLAKFDRDTLVSILSQREDISSEQVNEIINNIESVRDQIREQAQKAQDKAQAAIDRVFDQIRQYLNNMERPELNYEGIKRDLQKLLEDPQAGLEQLRDRLSQFDRDTLVALFSANPALSQKDADHLISQIEQVRDRVLTRAERLQEQAQHKIEQIQQKASQQIKETRKVTATAAWWLFGTALTSVGIAALAGVVAVRGLDLFS